MKKKVLITATVQSHICQFHRPFVEMMHENGYEVHVAAFDNLAEKNGLKLDFADRVFNVMFARSPFSKSNLNAYRQIKRIIDDQRYDIIYCNTPVGGVVTRLAAREARKNNGAKVFYTAHGFHFFKGASKKNWIIYYTIEKYMSRLTDVLITINKEDYKLAKAKLHCQVAYIHGVGVNSAKYRVFSEEEKVKVKTELGYQKDTPLILCVGELLDNKNQAMAIRALAQVIKSKPDCRLIMAGNGKNKDFLKQLSIEMGVAENVDFLGYCTELEKYENISDIAISCSYREGLPLNIMEAMLVGKPVVATDNRGHRDLVANEKNGFIVRLNDNFEMAEKVLFLLNHKDKMLEMGQAGIEKVRSFTDVEVKKELSQVFVSNSNK